MIWVWLGSMVLIGFMMGCFTAWSGGGVRVFMKTLAIPVLVVLSRILFYNTLPLKNSLLFAFLDFVILAAMALVGDYVVGLKLGRSDRQGYRDDHVGH